MSNPKPEGLPRRIDLGGGYALTKPAIPMCEASQSCWAVTGGVYAGNAGYIHNNEAEAFVTAMNAHTDALGAALEAMLNHDPKHRTYSPEVEYMADAALEAWKAGR